MCGIEVTWHDVIGNLPTALAYVKISAVLAYLLVRASGGAEILLFGPVVVFGSFIALCGMHHATLAAQALCYLLGFGCIDLEAFATFWDYAMMIASVGAAWMIAAYARRIARVFDVPKVKAALLDVFAAFNEER